MSLIDMENWKRQKVFQIFMDQEIPHWSATVPVDISTLEKYAKQNSIKLFPSMLFCLSIALAKVPEFNQRIRSKNSVYQHKNCNTSFTIAREDGTLGFAYVPFTESWSEFSKNYELGKEESEKADEVKETEGRDDVTFFSFIPWFSFTSLTNSVFNRMDSFPRLSWGKKNKDGEVNLMVQTHHALIDAAHVGQFLSELQSILSSPADYLK